MGFFDFFKTKNRDVKPVSLVNNNIYDILPKYNEYYLFMNMVKGKRFEDMFIGNTGCIQDFKRIDFKNWLFNCVENGLMIITAGDESISNSLSKKDLVDLCISYNVAASGNKIDLVKKLIKVNENCFDAFSISNWILLSAKGKNSLSEYMLKFKSEYDDMQQYVYNLFLNGRITEALKIVDSFKKSYPFNKNNGFSLNIEGDSLKEIVNLINDTDILNKIGVNNAYNNTIKSILCMHYCFGDFDYERKILELYPDIELIFKKSRLIKNKNQPFLDLMNHIRGFNVRKYD